MALSQKQDHGVNTPCEADQARQCFVLAFLRQKVLIQGWRR